MWQVDNRTPFAAERAWVRDRDGTEVWLVAVKATFDIGPGGRLSVSEEQPPALRVAEHHGEPGQSSVKYDADLVLIKQTTDVLVVGHAFAPNGGEATQVDVGFAVGALRKSLRVIGDRSWGSLGASAPQPFRKIPLIYERAFGGVDPQTKNPQTDFEWRNPVGTGFAGSARHAAGLALPNVEDPRQLIGSWSDRPAPAGFGAIANHWPPRVGFAGTYDDHWMKTRQPLLAEDLDDRYFQSAPPDQQTAEFLRGGEPVALRNLTPDGELRFYLPKLYFGFETRFTDGSRERHTNRRLHTVIIEPDFPRVSVVWHTALPCHFKVNKLERTLVFLKTDVSAREEEEDDEAELEEL